MDAKKISMLGIAVLIFVALVGVAEARLDPHPFTMTIHEQGKSVVTAPNYTYEGNTFASYIVHAGAPLQIDCKETQSNTTGEMYTPHFFDTPASFWDIIEPISIYDPPRVGSINGYAAIKFTPTAVIKAKAGPYMVEVRNRYSASFACLYVIPRYIRVNTIFI